MHLPPRHRGDNRRRARLTTVPVALLLAMPLLIGAASPDSSVFAVGDATPGQARSQGVDAGSTVTLITGDRVAVADSPSGWRATPEGTSARDRGAWLHQYDVDGQLYVVPSDAAALVPHVLDRELFNVTKLAEHGYTGEVPVIVTSDAASGFRAMATEGMSVTTTLPSIDGFAATIAPEGGWWDAVQAGTPGVVHGAALPGVEKVWLDEPAEVLLDESVPMIGAPAAWDAGFDGTGVTVAVLDSGIDADHPDLAGKVVAAENFTADPDASDDHGHGTHVAGIIAGTGAGSEGTYVGTAPGAELLNGKVCNAAGSCPQSSIIAGMEWAVELADVINMSVGTLAGSDGTDPMSQAVNTLTAEHDVLFVIAAGNSGQFGDGTVGSPGAADAALTVGSVDKAGELAPTSSRGPRLGDFAIKPDITGPGVGIVSALAGGIDRPPGTEPVGEHYLRASGTSMAAPHVTGAAAIQLQREPELDAATLKAALTTTGTPRDELTPYQQGGGLVNIPAALDARLRATPATLSLGHFPWPHDGRDPVRATVSYTNLSDTDLTVALTPQLSGESGDPVAPGAVTVTPDSFTLPPGGTTDVEVTLDTTVEGNGVFGGYLTAATPGGEVLARIPTGFAKEHEVLGIGDWRQEQKLTASATEPEAAYGRSIALDGDTMIVGAAGNSDGEVSRGAAYVLTRDGEEWVPQARLIASDAAAFSSFGASVALDGDTAVIGASTAIVDGEVSRGAAYVFTRSGDTWTEQAKLVASDGGAVHNFGVDVALAGDTVLVGAPNAAPGGASRQGAVYAYTRSGETWTEQQILAASDGAPGDGFGNSVAISGGTAVVGAPFKTIDFNFIQGAAYVFGAGDGGWTEQTRLLASDGAGFQGYGYSVAASGGTILVGTPAAEVSGSARGAAYVLTGAGDSWVEQAKLTADEAGEDGNEVGTDVALDGDTALVGGPWTPVDGNPVQGAAWVFTRAGADWSRDAKLTAADGAPDDFLGGAVALADGTAFTGAWLADVGEEDCRIGDPSCGEQGAAYTFSADLLLDATAGMFRGRWYAELSWIGAADEVDLYRDGERIATVADSRTYTDELGRARKGDRFSYLVCHAGTDDCADEVTVEIDPRGGPRRPPGLDLD